MLNRLAVSSCDRTSALEALPSKFDTQRRSPSIFYILTGQRARLKNFRIKSLLPSTDYYMTYEGSLTQPGCQESVTWILLNKPIYVNNDQVRLITCRRHIVAFGEARECFVLLIREFDRVQT